MIATAQAAATVMMSMDKRRVGSVGLSASAIEPARKKMPMADASAISKLISLVRKRLIICNALFPCRDKIAGWRGRQQRCGGECSVVERARLSRIFEKARRDVWAFRNPRGRNKGRRFEIKYEIGR